MTQEDILSKVQNIFLSHIINYLDNIYFKRNFILEKCRRNG